MGALLESCVHDGLRCDRLSSTLAFIGSEEYLALAVKHAITKGLGRETCEDDGVDGTDTSAGEEGGDGLPCHGQVDRDGVALLDAQRLEDIGDAAHFTEKLRVRNFPALVGFIGFVDDGGLSYV